MDVRTLLELAEIVNFGAKLKSPTTRNGRDSSKDLKSTEHARI